MCSSLLWISFSKRLFSLWNCSSFLKKGKKIEQVRTAVLRRLWWKTKRGLFRLTRADLFLGEERAMVFNGDKSMFEAIPDRRLELFIASRARSIGLCLSWFGVTGPGNTDVHKNSSYGLMEAGGKLIFSFSRMKKKVLVNSYWDVSSFSEAVTKAGMSLVTPLMSKINAILASSNWLARFAKS